jgi:hypothetical protein
VKRRIRSYRAEMTIKQIHLGSAISLLAFAGVVLAGGNISASISRSVVVTDIFLGVAALSLLGCAYFLPRSARLWLRRR